MSSILQRMLPSRPDVRPDVPSSGPATGRFREVYVEADSAVCEMHGPKGRHAAARAGRLSGFTGVDAPPRGLPVTALRLVDAD